MKKVLFAFTAASLLLAACGEEEETLAPREQNEPSSPVNVLKNVAISFNQRDIGLLKVMLSEDFIFHFDPRDVGESPPGKPGYKIPASWPYNEFWPAASNIFKRAPAVSCSIATSGVGTPAENEIKYKAEEVTISVLVMVNELEGYIAQDGYCGFEFERYEAARGKEYWRLINWWDFTSVYYDANPGVAPTSLGRILAVFY